MGELVKGLAIVAPTAKTTTGTGTAVAIGAVGTGQRLVAMLHVIAKTGGGTLDVVLQSDNAEGMGTPTTRITFDQVSAIGSQTKIITTAITDTWYRESRTITSGSFTYVVSIGVAGAASDIDSTLPPAAQDALVLAAPIDLGGGAQAITMLVGVAGQMGSTAGSDTNDPTYAAGPPAKFTYGANDYITHGNVLDSVFTASQGWSIIVAGEPNAGDLAALRFLISRYATAPNEQFQLAFSTDGTWLLDVKNLSGNADSWKSNAATTAAKHVYAASFDPSLTRASRAALYHDGALAAATHTPTGGDTAVDSAAAELRIGMKATDTGVGIAAMGAYYVYNRPLTAQEQSDNRAWLVAQGWS